MKIFGKDVAVSLVDDSIIFATHNQTPPLILPAYVAIQTGTTSVLACGEEAKAMLGREPNNISVVRVLQEGVISDQQSAESLFRFGLRNFLGSVLIRPRVIIASRTYDPGMLSVKNMATAGGAREVYLIEMGMATAIGMQLDVQKPEVKAVLSISDDWFEFSIISLAGVLSASNGAIGSRAFVEDIQNHFALTRQFRPEFTALDSSLHKSGVNPNAVVDLPGWETWVGRTEQGRLTAQNVSRDEITVGMMPSVIRLTERIKDAIRRLPNDKQYQLNRTTIHATGTTLAIPGIAQLMANQLGHSVTPFAAEVHPSIDGCRTVLNELNFLKRVKTTKK
jgi:rod shape-determining protein MreB and related proteins